MLVELVRISRQGHLARRVHLAALGYEVPEELIPGAGRFDMENLCKKPEPDPQRVVPLEAPDFEAIEQATRAALLQQGQDADEVLRRATGNVERAGERRDPPTDAVIRRTTDWVLGRA